MRIRSVLAATVLAAALTAAGAATASATQHDKRGGKDEEAVCSPYFGGLQSLENKIFWGGAHCSDYLR
ncbi:hypothetical protein [Streptomyces capoamus]|uniref:hypothetical protein n=1 Tax=Streptomyces capoamus TaxID=68183 RepID=UPI003392CB5A